MPFVILQCKRCCHSGKKWNLLYPCDSRLIPLGLISLYYRSHHLLPLPNTLGLSHLGAAQKQSASTLRNMTWKSLLITFSSPAWTFISVMTVTLVRQVPDSKTERSIHPTHYFVEFRTLKNCFSVCSSPPHPLLMFSWSICFIILMFCFFLVL